MNPDRKAPESECHLLHHAAKQPLASPPFNNPERWERLGRPSRHPEQQRHMYGCYLLSGTVPSDLHEASMSLASSRYSIKIC